MQTESTPLRDQVFVEATAELSQYSWFRGICCDNAPTEEDIKNDGVKYWVDSLVFETAMWDDPQFFDKFGD